MGLTRHNNNVLRQSPRRAHGESAGHGRPTRTGAQPPRDPRATAACQHSEKVRQAWKAKAFDEMTRSTEKALREGTPAEKKVALQVANAAAGAIASVGGPHTRTVAQSYFQREDLQGHGQQRWQQTKVTDEELVASLRAVCNESTQWHRKLSQPIYKMKGSKSRCIEEAKTP